MSRRAGRRRRPQRAPAPAAAARPRRTAILCGALFVSAFLLSHWVDSRWEQQEDADITYHYAQRLAAGHGFTFRDGAPPSYGTTTPLWTLILAAGARASW